MLIDEQLVIKLIAEQFPLWSNLSIKQVEVNGHDNKSFRLGDKMLIRLPSAQNYATQVLKEQKYLPLLAPYLSHPIPKPIALGQSSTNYPFNWSIYNWLDGESVNNITLNDAELRQLAKDLANFLNELYKIDAKNGPPAGTHNYWRGGDLSVYDSQSKELFNNLKNIIDSTKANKIWQQALNSKWQKEPVWIHGDFAIGNILVKNGKLAAIIDFGCSAIGDPACDLVPAWTIFDNDTRKIFRNNLNLDISAWQRAQGWALWKACFELNQLEDKISNNYAKKQIKIIKDVLSESHSTSQQSAIIYQ